MKNGINPALNIAIIGGGINGLCSAWVLAQQGHGVQLFERDALMQATSRSSSKLLHGGLRYLENYEFRLVREALRERDAWLQRAPQLAQPLRLVLPIYQNSRRSRALVALGLWLYDHIAGRSILPPAQWLSRAELLQRDPQLQADGLLGGTGIWTTRRWGCGWHSKRGRRACRSTSTAPCNASSPLAN